MRPQASLRLLPVIGGCMGRTGDFLLLSGDNRIHIAVDFKLCIVEGFNA